MAGVSEALGPLLNTTPLGILLEKCRCQGASATLSALLGATCWASFLSSAVLRLLVLLASCCKPGFTQLGATVLRAAHVMGELK